MSRRESRVSMGARQTDALSEFENFKKKFLQANKQITKLNSTMSQRIEELNAQISTLYNENLRLRASEIALATELKREREKSRRIMDDVENMALGLVKHAGFLRQTFHIRHTSDTPSPTPPPIPRATTTRASPPSPRLSRQPTVPGIFEEDEPPDRPKSKTKRLSASKLPLPARASPPPTEKDKKKKIPSTSAAPSSSTRRQSGLFPTPVPIVDELAVTSAVPLDDYDDDVILLEDDPELEPEPEPMPAKKEKRRKKEVAEPEPQPQEVVRKPKLRDLTNEPRRRSSPVEPPPSPPRQFLTESPPRNTMLPTPQPSESPEPMDGERATRRVRKSVNYAEPKLNTKMRKPDSTPAPAKKQRSSAAGALDDRKVTLKRSKSKSNAKFAYDEDEHGDEHGDEEGGECVPVRLGAGGRDRMGSVRDRLGGRDVGRDDEDEDDDRDGEDADEEFVPAPSWITDSRRRSVDRERRHSMTG